ncbi:MAG TPA: class I SAM-dependent methyltransferase [Chitinophagaceae bacterium]|nr:class I SAM-dependent methyltransferase [Chitinophagaceae bacterium]
MKSATVAEQPFDFSGDVPRRYDEYSGPMFFEPYAVEVAHRIDPVSISVALELASGTGCVTSHLRHVLPSKTTLIASDVSADMLAVAKEKLHGANIDWLMIDAQELPFDEASTDLVVCCFGYMFVADKLKAFKEVHRVLRPGGMVLFTTWDKLEVIGAVQVYRQVVKQYLTDPLPESYNLPYSMHDASAIRELLSQAGFSKISIEKVAKDSVSPSSGFAAEALTQGGVIYKEIMRRNPAWIDEIKVRVEQDLGEKFGASPMIAPMSAVISQAWK